MSDTDRRVCEIVGIPGKWIDFPPVSTSFAACEPVLEWLRQNGLEAIYFGANVWVEVHWRSKRTTSHVTGDTLPATLCAAVLKINEAKGA